MTKDELERGKSYCFGLVSGEEVCGIYKGSKTIDDHDMFIVERSYENPITKSIETFTILVSKYNVETIVLYD